MILDAITCDSFRHVLRIVAYLFNILQWVIPIVLILLITIDFAKIIVHGDEKQIQEGLNRAVKRIIYAVVIFLIPIVVKFTLKTVGNSIGEDSNSWLTCFNTYFE